MLVNGFMIDSRISLIIEADNSSSPGAEFFSPMIMSEISDSDGGEKWSIPL